MTTNTIFTPEHYEKNIHRTIPHYSSFQKEIIDLIRSTKPNCEVWLDTGCGTGSLIELANETFDECNFYLNDPSEEMLSYTKTRLGKYPTERFKFTNYTTADLPLYEVPKCDVVTAIQSHHYLNRKERASTTAKCYGMLKRGGIFVTFENTAPATEKGIDIVMDRLRRFQLEYGKDSVAVEENLKRFNTAYFPITISEHIELLKETGFTTCELFWTSYMQAGFYAIK